MLILSVLFKTLAPDKFTKKRAIKQANKHTLVKRKESSLGEKYSAIQSLSRI